MSKALVIKEANFSTNKVSTIDLTVVIPCTGITLDKATSTISAIGTTDTLTATVTPADCTQIVSWSSSDTSVASVADGVVTAEGLGTATITATCGDFSATCTVTVSVTPDYVLVAGYAPERRTSDGPAATTGKKTASTESKNHIIAQNSADTSIYPVESKSDVDTSPWRFVPISIPSGATGIKISTVDETTAIKTRTLFFNRDVAETTYNIGATCLYGTTSAGGFDQSDWAVTQTIPVPSVSGIDSFAGLLYYNGTGHTSYQDYSSLITVEFTTT